MPAGAWPGFAWASGGPPSPTPRPRFAWPRRPVSTASDPEASRQAYFNAARIYAQAVEFAAGEVSLQGERAVALYRTYRTRALDLLDQALKGVSPEDRTRFLSDPALKPLRLAPGRTSSCTRAPGY